MASRWALTSPGRSSDGPYRVNTFRKRGPEIARSHPLPDWDLNIAIFQLSNDGRHRFTAARRLSLSLARVSALPHCGQLIVTGIAKTYRRLPSRFKLSSIRVVALDMRRNYGWIVLMVAAAAMVGSLPGRTQGLGLITEPLLLDLRMDRVSYAQLNLWATLIGSAGALGIGYAIDRAGSRIVLTVVLAALGAVVCFMSRASSFAAMAIWITLTRALGQSALSVASLAIVGQWFVRRIDTAMAVYSVAISIGFMAAFPLVGYLVQAWGWRSTWFAIGSVIAFGLAPLSLLVVRRSPESSGLLPDGDDGSQLATANSQLPTPKSQLPSPNSQRPIGNRQFPNSIELPGYAWTEALATPSFWVFAVGTALYGLVASGIGLFNESILAQRGFGPQVYYQTLAVTALTALIGNFAGGWLAGRVALGRLMAVSQFVLAGGLIVLPLVSTMTQVMVWASAMGLGGGLVMVLFFSVWGRVFGRRHLGRIQGAAQALTVIASAVGPLLLAWCLEVTGSYAAMFQILAAVIALVAVAALLMSLPEPVGVAAIGPWSNPNEGDAAR
jgi:MFS family permease